MPKTTRHGGGTPPIVTRPQSQQAVGEQGPEIVQVPEGTSVQPASSDTPYAGMTNDELRAELGKRDLATSGTKSDLIDRLLDDDTKPDTDGD